MTLNSSIKQKRTRFIAYMSDSMPKRVLSIFGTRPEAIKMAPLIKALEMDDFFDQKVCVTAQHREMLDQVLSLFNIYPDFDLNIMRPEQSLTDLTINILKGVEGVLTEWQPDVVLY